MIIESHVDSVSKAIHVINFDYRNIYEVGRKINNDITVSDISVSRV